MSFELHGFSVASSQAYGAVVYLRTIYDDETISSVIVTSKTRVAQVKHQTIPRLELLGALVLTRLVSTVRKSLDSSTHLNCFYWTDSTVVLFWIRNNKPWRQYVAHRVNEIRTLSLQEDIVLGQSIRQTCCQGDQRVLILPKSAWPEFLYKPKAEWPDTTDLSNIEKASQELIKDVPVISHSFAILSIQFRLQNIIDCKRFGSLHKLLHTTAYVIRFSRSLHNCSTINVPTNSQAVANASCLSGEEIREAESYWIKSIQGEVFSAEIKHLATEHSGEGPTLVKQFALVLN